MLWRKILLTVSVMLWYLFLLFLFEFLRVEYSHTYADLIQGLEGSLPLLTTAVALPILGGETPARGNSWLFYAFWGVLFAAPAIVLFLIWRARDRLALAEVWLYPASIYLVFFVLSFALIATGLWLPFALF